MIGKKTALYLLMKPMPTYVLEKRQLEARNLARQPQVVTKWQIRTRIRDGKIL
jgi:hypothetical protein